MPSTDQISADKIKSMRAAFEDAVNSIRSASTLKAVQDAIAAGDVDRLIRILGLDETTFAPLTEALRDSYITGGQYAAEVLTPIPTVDGPVAFRFDLTATEAARWISTESSRMVTEMLDDQKQMVRSVIAAGTQAGIGPRQQALDLVGRVGTNGVRRGGFVGLTTQQAGWVSSARDELAAGDPHYFTRSLRDKRFDAVIRRAIKDGKPVPKKTIDAAITAMQSRAQKYRGDVIARTEAIKGLRAGQAEGIVQGIRKGDIEPSDVTIRWDATGDSRTRLDHMMMEDKTVRLGQPFTLPDGSNMMYPGDDSLGAPAGQVIQCRCRAEYKVDFIGRAIRMQGFR